MRRGHRPGSNAGVPRPNGTGSRNSQAKLSEGEVAAIVLMHAQGDSFRELGAGFGVSSSTISRAVNGQTWRHVRHNRRLRS